MKRCLWPIIKANKLLTFTAARMLHGKVQSIETNFLFKQTFVVVCCAIGWTYGFFVSWTAVQTHTACIIRSKSLTQTVIMTCYIYTRIQVWKTNIQVMESDGIISDSFISISSIDKTVWNLELSGNWVKVKAMFTVYRIACAPPRKSYRIGLLFTQKNGCGGVISVPDGERPYLADL